MDDLIDLNEAARLTGIPAPSLRRRLNSTGPDALPGVRVLQGRREVWRLRLATVDALLSGAGKADYAALIEQWKLEMASGYHTGRPLGQRTISTLVYAWSYYWRHLGQAPSIEAITAHNLKLALANVPVDYVTRNCHHTQRQQMFDAVRSFTRLLIREGLRSEIDLAAIATLKPKRIFPPRRTSLKPEALEAILKECDVRYGRTEHDAVLNRTAVMLMTLGGLRKMEAIRLEVGHIDLERAELWVIDGKGHKDRMVGMSPDLVEQVRKWLRYRQPGYPNLLLSRDGFPLTDTGLQQRFDHLRKAAGIDITLHGLRRTCATLMVDSGVPLVHVQRNLGHRQISTTMQYVQTDQQTAAESFKRFSLGSLSGIPTNSPAPPPADAPVKPDAVLGFVKAKRGKK